jgi:hypothetical protein
VKYRWNLISEIFLDVEVEMSLLVTSHDEESLVGDSGLFEDVKDIGDPLVLIDHRVKVVIDLLFPSNP